jgi:hypothetical protein
MTNDHPCRTCEQYVKRYEFEGCGNEGSFPAYCLLCRDEYFRSVRCSEYQELTGI